MSKSSAGAGVFASFMICFNSFTPADGNTRRDLSQMLCADVIMGRNRVDI
jgi:hypothetical protein